MREEAAKTRENTGRRCRLAREKERRVRERAFLHSCARDYREHHSSREGNEEQLCERERQQESARENRHNENERGKACDSRQKELIDDHTLRRKRE